MIKNIVKITVGTIMLVTVLIGYLPQPEYLVELTCISNTLGGLLLLADGALNITLKKNFPNSFYQNVVVSIFTVFLVCMGSLTGAYKFNFKGAFFFMHVVNPIAFVTCYMLFVNERSRKIRFAFTAPIMIMLYLLFDCTRCQFTGEFIYGFVEPEEFTFFYALIAGLFICFFECLLGLGIYALNRLVHKKSTSGLSSG
ncbi:MAG: hypothetical protein K2N38_14690 [Oscillospiraceae bacterium]|nr:hypothetical protein [Oscillospiraceae bacterium]